jgi:hypothetical protein
MNIHRTDSSTSVGAIGTIDGTNPLEINPEKYLCHIEL